MRHMGDFWQKHYHYFVFFCSFFNVQSCSNIFLSCDAGDNSLLFPDFLIYIFYINRGNVWEIRSLCRVTIVNVFALTAYLFMHI